MYLYKVTFEIPEGTRECVVYADSVAAVHAIVGSQNSMMLSMVQITRILTARVIYVNHDQLME